MAEIFILQRHLHEDVYLSNHYTIVTFRNSNMAEMIDIMTNLKQYQWQWLSIGIVINFSLRSIQLDVTMFYKCPCGLQ